MGHVYFVQEVESGAIKIGWSSNLRKRVLALQAYSPNKLKLLAAFEGTLDTEKKVHESFKEYRIRGEWFRPEKELLDLIEKNKLQEVPLNLEKAVQQYNGQPSSEEGKECRKWLELAEYHIEDTVPEPESEDMLSVEEAASALGISSQTLRNWEKKGIFVPTRSAGGHRRYKRADVLALRKQQMTGFEFVLPCITVNDLWESVRNLLAPFDPMEKINVSIRQDSVLNKVQIIVDSEDGLITINKNFTIKD